MFYNYVGLLKEGRYIEWILMDFIHIYIYISIVSGSIMVCNIYIYTLCQSILYTWDINQLQLLYSINHHMFSLMVRYTINYIQL